MAISIIDAPINYNPAYSPCIYTVSGSNSSETSFRFIAEVYAGAGTDFIGEMKSIPHPTSGYGKFDVSKFVQTALDEVIDFDDNIYTSKEIRDTFLISFGGEYIDSNGDFQRNTGVVGDVNVFFNASPFYREYITLREAEPNNPYVISDYQVSDYDKFPLTSRRSIQTVRGTKQWLTYMPTRWQNVSGLEVQQTDSGPNADVINLPVPLQNNDDGDAISFRVDPDAIEAQTTLSNLEEYRVRTIDDIADETSAWTNFKVLRCNKWELYSLYYLNRWGGIDSMSFNGRKEETVSSQRDSYNTIQNQMDANGMITYDSKIHTRRDYNVSYNTQFVLTTDWISEEMQHSAVDLQTSPVVWLEDSEGVILPVNVSSDSLEINERREGLINVSMTVRYTQPQSRQQS